MNIAPHYKLTLRQIQYNCIDRCATDAYPTSPFFIPLCTLGLLLVSDLKSNNFLSSNLQNYDGFDGIIDIKITSVLSVGGVLKNKLQPLSRGDNKIDMSV